MPFWKPHGPPPDAESAWLVVGLGNPGARFESTRHNAGYMVVAGLADRSGLRFKGSRQLADVARGPVEGVDTILAQPLTFMNESGNAVTRLLSYFKIPTQRLIVVCDDLDLPFGTLRVRAGGSSGGQKGLEDVIRQLGTQEFARVRFGIGRPAGNTIAHVLQPFSPQERPQLQALVTVAGDATVAVMREGVTSAMNLYNRSWSDALT